VVLVVCMFMAANPSSPIVTWGVAGLIERLVFADILGWYAVTGWQLQTAIVPARTQQSLQAKRAA